MRWNVLAFALFLASAYAQGQNATLNPIQSKIQIKQAADPAEQERRFQARRQNFDSGRQVLLNKGVPFDPDELLRDRWTPEVKNAIESMPEMRESRYERAPLQGAYVADTLYLPEHVQLSGHTVILAHYVVFEGKNPVIKGNFDVHFFPMKPVAVLETTLADVLHRNGRKLNVSLGRKIMLPGFPMIQVPGMTARHSITIDVSGPPDQVKWETHPVPRSASKLKSQLQNIAWSGFESLPLTQQTIPCTTSCNNDGGPGNSGRDGANGSTGPVGNPNGGLQAPNGSCGSGQSPNGFFGTEGGKGGTGLNGQAGGTASAGFNAGTINATIADNDVNQYTFFARGGSGGAGGSGGNGGVGGTGGAGAAGGNGTACGCTVGIGGAGGKGGDAGPGGNGGNGGQGGNGGNGGTINWSIPFNGSDPITDVSAGRPGQGGAGGLAGGVGIPGPAGAPGKGAEACGQTASDGQSQGGGGVTASPGNPGNPGANGASSGVAGTVNPTVRPDPNSGGDGGGTGDPQCEFRFGGGGDNQTPCSPIIIDTEREGFHLTSAFAGVSFDIRGDGHPVAIAWTDPHFHNAFLALPGSDGLVHTGKELFGNFTSQPVSANPNGFLALAQYDKKENGGNGDGIIDERDEVYSRLRLWIDENHDGVCQPEELHRLPEFGVYSLALNYVSSKRQDEFGNQFRFKARVNPGERRDPRDETPNGAPGRWTYDVFFVVK
ncbi:MAG TPA: hypothetical protein VKZ53_12430 [Candidatus Angelobacter sp.]|nr:hypothetical protein [Candidatus Angelobacter sp.]